MKWTTLYCTLCSAKDERENDAINSSELVELKAKSVCCYMCTKLVDIIFLIYVNLFKDDGFLL